MAKLQWHCKVSKEQSRDGTALTVRLCAARTLAYRLPPRPAAQVVAQDQIRGGLLAVASMHTVDGQGHRKLPGNATQRNKFKEMNVMAVLEATLATMQGLQPPAGILVGGDLNST